MAASCSCYMFEHTLMVQLYKMAFSQPITGGNWAKSPATIKFRPSKGEFSLLVIRIICLLKWNISHTDNIDTSSKNTYSTSRSHALISLNWYGVASFLSLTPNMELYVDPSRRVATLPVEATTTNQ